MKTLWTIVLATLAIAPLGIIANARAEAPTSKDLVPIQRPLAELKPPSQSDASLSASIKVSAWLDRDNAIYKAGDKLVLSVKASRDAYITVLDVGTSGKVHVVFPNEFQQDNFIKVGQVVQIPGHNAGFDFLVGGPTGNELLKVFASENPAPLFDPVNLLPTGLFKTHTAKADTVAKDLVITLREQHAQGWNQAIQTFRIVD